jgi:SulP family sulfate permease
VPVVVYALVAAGLAITESHIWDASTVAALDQVVEKYAHRGKTVELVGMNEASTDFHGNLAGTLQPAG